jgi:hypothetical protein
MRPLSMKLPFGLCLALAAVGCATSTTIPAGVPVRTLVAKTLTFHGTASPSLANPSCAAADHAKPIHVLELTEDTRATILLTPSLGEPALPLATLRLTNLETNKTWCVMTQTDGTPAALGGEFPSGQYAVNVAEVSSAPPRKYEVRVEKL